MARGIDGFLVDQQRIDHAADFDQLPPVAAVVGEAGDFASGEVGEGFSDSSIRFPTTIAKVDNRLLVVNSQFDRRQSGQGPELPFTVSGVEIPK